MDVENGEVRAEIGQWYSRADKGEIFRVVDIDETTGTIEIQTFDGDLDEIDAETWNTLPLAVVEPPEDLTGPMNGVESDDLGYTETEMTAADWTQPLQPIRQEGELWEDTESEEDWNRYGEGTPEEPYVADIPEANQRAL